MSVCSSFPDFKGVHGIRLFVDIEAAVDSKNRPAYGRITQQIFIVYVLQLPPVALHTLTETLRYINQSYSLTRESLMTIVPTYPASVADGYLREWWVKGATRIN